MSGAERCIGGGAGGSNQGVIRSGSGDAAAADDDDDIMAELFDTPKAGLPTAAASTQPRLHGIILITIGCTLLSCPWHARGEWNPLAMYGRQLCKLEPPCEARAQMEFHVTAQDRQTGELPDLTQDGIINSMQMNGAAVVRGSADPGILERLHSRLQEDIGLLLVPFGLLPPTGHESEVVGLAPRVKQPEGRTHVQLDLTSAGDALDDVLGKQGPLARLSHGVG